MLICCRLDTIFFVLHLSTSPFYFKVTAAQYGVKSEEQGLNEMH